MKPETKEAIKYIATRVAALLGIAAFSVGMFLYLLIADAEGWTL